MKIAFFDAKSYDLPGFRHYTENTDLEIKYFEPKLNVDTVSLAAGFDAVCVFVNDTVNREIIDRLCELGVKTVALRCAGFKMKMIPAKTGTPAITTRERRTSHISMKIAIRTRLKTSRTKLMIPLDSASETELT